LIIFAGLSSSEDVFCDSCQEKMTQITACDWVCQNIKCASKLTYETPPSSDDENEGGCAADIDYNQIFVAFMWAVRKAFNWGK
jgi:hypothetical protein